MWGRNESWIRSGIKKKRKLADGSYSCKIAEPWPLDTAVIVLLSRAQAPGVLVAHCHGCDPSCAVSTAPSAGPCGSPTKSPSVWWGQDSWRSLWAVQQMLYSCCMRFLVMTEMRELDSSIQYNSTCAVQKVLKFHERITVMLLLHEWVVN